LNRIVCGVKTSQVRITQAMEAVFSVAHLVHVHEERQNSA